MQRNVLDLYLTKVSSGDKQYLEKLYSRLAERLLWAPVSVVEETSRDGEAIQRCELVTIKVGSDPFLPVFTSESKLREWLSVNRITASNLSMMGRDLCRQLDIDLALLVNEGSANCVELTPQDVKNISEIEIEDHASQMPKDAMPQRDISPTTEQGHHSIQATYERTTDTTSDMSGRTVEIVVDLKKVQELVRKQILEQAAATADKGNDVITLYDVVQDEAE